MITGIEHILLAMPHGEEARAIAFYADILGLQQIRKPAALDKNGGAWFSNGTVMVHLGVEQDFHPACKAHPAFAVEDIDAFAEHLESNGLELAWDTRLLPTTKRFFIADPFGNRIECLQHIAY